MRAPLSRDRVLRAAIALADRDGLEALSMRRLADELGVKAMSLYNHVSNKDDLLDGMVDLVVREFEPADREAEWKPAIRASVLSAREALSRHTWAAGLMFSTGESPARMRYSESILATFRDGGFSPELTHHAYHLLDGHIIGFTLWVASFSFDTEDLPELAAGFLQRLPADEFPYMVEHVKQHMEPSEEDTSTFELGLDLILDGLERLRDRA